jgi:importin-7
MRILSDTNFGSDDCEYDEIEEKTIAAMGILKTLSSLILALESSTAIILELEAIILPAIIFVLSHSILDMYEEIFEMVGTILFCAKQVSPNMWEVFPYIFSTFKSDAYDYLGEMLPPLDNFIAYGKEYLLQHKDYQMNILEMISILLTDNNSSESDQIRACQLIESMLLNLRGGIDEVDYIINISTFQFFWN